MKIIVGKNKFDVEVASAPLKKTIGLMFRRKISPLLFVFDEEFQWPFHMLFVLKPILMVFISKEKKIVEIKGAKPFEFFIKPSKPVKYVLEAPETWKKFFKPGMKLLFK